MHPKTTNPALCVLCAVLMAAVGVSCDSHVFYSNSQRVDASGWNLADTRTFDVEVRDTTRLYTFLIDVRLTVDYPYRNLFFFVNTTFPDGGVATDTVECPVAQPDGQWLGKRAGGYIDNRYSFRKNMIFPAPGRYRFEIAHAMRDTNIVGVKNVGLRIEQSAPRQ